MKAATEDRTPRSSGETEDKKREREDKKRERDRKECQTKMSPD